MLFVQPILLYLLILIPMAALFLLWADRRRATAMKRLGRPALIARLSENVNGSGRRWQAWLWLLALPLLIIALARPQWGSETQVVQQRGVQVMVALDISESMLAEDIKPNRLTRAKLEIGELMNRLNGDDIGLVLFAGASFIQFPLTSDYGTARSFLDSAAPGIISRSGTNIGEAIQTAMSGFDEGRASQKVIVVITDGENHEADTLNAAQEAADAGIRLYAIGFGSPEGEPIPDYDGEGDVVGFKKNRQGEVILSKLDEETLQQIATIGRGHYYRARADGAELDALLSVLGTLQKESLETQVERRGIERFQIFLLLALACLIGMELIPERLRKAPRIYTEQGHR